jgi:hypothetical protein
MPNPGYRTIPLTDEDIIEMRTLYASGGRRMSTSYLGWMFETTTANVHLIVTGQTHKNVGGPISPVKGPTTEAEVLEIRELRAKGYDYYTLSEKFEKSQVALRSICSGKSFPHVGGPRSGQVGMHCTHVGRPPKKP